MKLHRCIMLKVKVKLVRRRVYEKHCLLTEETSNCLHDRNFSPQQISKPMREVGPRNEDRCIVHD